ncbi:hypothetical protein I6F37_37670 [Bradyrhizobium sp. NBAIM08]|nr:hypothetical protein [Bradyrhizobium sp. BRP05]MCA1394567.1 hypothetical protein [Bradyrhizobium sp. IC3123]MCA1424195.1 hypothetical protein [Bradyrhizobium sp. BRP23]MCA1431289.1 hypothetical protein [Bradyrhizobium sp. NBAIM16]MCA1480674.1 hypothetical protein [Bradyrhizobium sp. NBAIM08]MCA1509299.1 hypothetical protein [Bradyrhizobium sp. NBAIM02]
MAVSSGQSIGAVAKELGLRDSVLRRWVDKLRQEPASAARRPPRRRHRCRRTRLRRSPGCVRKTNDCGWSATFKKLSRTVARLCAA